MGRQINFRMADDDATAFVNRLQPTPVRLLSWRHPSNELTFLPSWRERNGPHLFLVRSQDLELVRLRHVVAQAYWIVDALRSPVIEWSPGLQDGSTIHPGRLHVNLDHVDETGERVRFPDGFAGWAKRLMEGISRTYVRDPSTGLYDGPAARELIAGGSSQEIHR